MEASQSADKWGIAIPLARAIAQRGSKPADQVHFLPSPRQVAGQIPGGPLTKTHESPDTSIKTGVRNSDVMVMARVQKRCGSVAGRGQCLATRS
ncbi:hypothetical protein THAR02_10319 [Trichoderma harzianum]|uniref:Uncharacterized protein n=1 Tax=Trichoderma harzianum TaxID=5544 RepID=A0A0F9WWN3_TRIHA|nr:hypothetical protein THAR02_10319 [Trichoderma harzianum]